MLWLNKFLIIDTGTWWPAIFCLSGPGSGSVKSVVRIRGSGCLRKCHGSTPLIETNTNPLRCGKLEYKSKGKYTFWRRDVNKYVAFSQKYRLHWKIKAQVDHKKLVFLIQFTEFVSRDFAESRSGSGLLLNTDPIRIRNRIQTKIYNDKIFTKYINPTHDVWTLQT
jgi:hypothetical protein